MLGMLLRLTHLLNFQKLNSIVKTQFILNALQELTDSRSIATSVPMTSAIVQDSGTFSMDVMHKSTHHPDMEIYSSLSIIGSKNLPSKPQFYKHNAP